MDDVIIQQISLTVASDKYRPPYQESFHKIRQKELNAFSTQDRAKNMCFSSRFRQN